MIFLQSKGLSRVFSNTTVQKHQFFSAQTSLWSNSYIYTLITWKTTALTIQSFVGKVMSLLFNMLSRFIIGFIPRSKWLLVSWLQSSPSLVILEPKKTKSDTASNFSHSICHKVMGPEKMMLVFECWVSSQLIHSPLSPSSRGSLVPLYFLPLEWYIISISEVVDVSCSNLDSSLSFIQYCISHDVLCIEVK